MGRLAVEHSRSPGRLTAKRIFTAKNAKFFSWIVCATFVCLAVKITFVRQPGSPGLIGQFNDLPY
jgi:hypothetical protein